MTGIIDILCLESATFYIQILETHETDVVPDQNNCDFRMSGSSGAWGSLQKIMVVDSSSQIAYRSTRSGITGVFRLTTKGFIDKAQD